MDKSTKITIILLVCIIGFVLLIRNPLVDFINQSLTKQELTQLNNNLLMEGLSIGLNESVFDETHGEYFNEIGGVNCRTFKHRANGLEVMLSGYPELTDAYRVTSLETTYTKHSIFTIHTNMSIDDATSILENRSYKVTDVGNHRIFTKYNVYIVLDYDAGEVKNIFVGIAANNDSDDLY